MAYSTVTLTGTYKLPDRTPAQGTVEVIPSEKKIIDSAGNVILSGRVKVKLDELGHFTVDLPATDDPSLNPTGFGYTVVAKLHHTHLPAVSFSLPTAVPVVDMADVESVDPSTFTPGVTYVTPEQLSLKANTADVDTALATKANTTDVNAALALKANASSLAAKADATRVDSLETLTTSGRLSEASLSATFARLPGPLGGWKAKLASDPANAKMVILGDSTSDATTGAYVMYARLLALHNQQGEPLHGLASSDYFTDGVGNATTTFTSATANFTAADVGRVIHGATFLTSTVITAVTNSTTVTLSLAVPTGTGLRFWVGRHIINGGNNGMPLVTWLNSPAAANPYNQNKFLAEPDVDLVVASWLINDVRTGLLGTTVDAIVAAGFTRLKAFVDLVRAQKPNADILLRMPNSLTTTNTGGSNYVTDGATVNPAGLAQVYSTALRRIYLRFVGLYPNVDVLDTQGEVFGTQSQSSSPYMADQLHPSLFTRRDLLNLVPVGGGYAALSDAIAARIGFKRNAFPADAAQMQREFLIDRAPAAGQVWLVSRDPNTSAVQVPVYKTDTLVINGLDASQALTGATFFKNSGAVALQISGLGATDFTPYIGKTAVIRGDHATATTGDRRNITVDIPSVAAGGYATVDVAVTGVRFSALDEPTGIIAQPGANLLGSGLVMLGAYVRATDSVRIVVHNPTGAAADPASESWTFWIVR